MTLVTAWAFAVALEIHKKFFTLFLVSQEYSQVQQKKHSSLEWSGLKQSKRE